MAGRGTRRHSQVGDAATKTRRRRLPPDAARRQHGRSPTASLQLPHSAAEPAGANTLARDASNAVAAVPGLLVSGSPWASRDENPADQDRAVLPRLASQS